MSKRTVIKHVEQNEGFALGSISNGVSTADGGLLKFFMVDPGGEVYQFQGPYPKENYCWIEYPHGGKKYSGSAPSNVFNEIVIGNWIESYKTALDEIKELILSTPLPVHPPHVRAVEKARKKVFSLIDSEKERIDGK